VLGIWWVLRVDLVGSGAAWDGGHCVGMVVVMG
jgi:hypothetical protein